MCQTRPSAGMHKHKLNIINCWMGADVLSCCSAYDTQSTLIKLLIHAHIMVQSLSLILALAPYSLIEIAIAQQINKIHLHMSQSTSSTPPASRLRCDVTLVVMLGSGAGQPYYAIARRCKDGADLTA